MNTLFANYLLESEPIQNPVTINAFEYLKTVKLDKAPMLKTWTLHDGFTVSFKGPQVAIIEVKVTHDGKAIVTQNKQTLEKFDFNSMAEFKAKIKQIVKVTEPPVEKEEPKKERATGKQVYVEKTYSVTPTPELYKGIREAVKTLKATSPTRDLRDCVQYVIEKIRHQVETSIPKEYKVKSPNMDLEYITKPKMLISGKLKLEIEMAQIESFEEYLSKIGFRINK